MLTNRYVLIVHFLFSQTGNQLELALKKIGRNDIVSKCICNVELVTDDMERALAKVRLDQSGFETLKDEIGPSRDASLRRDIILDKTFRDSQTDLNSSEKSKVLHKHQYYT